MTELFTIPESKSPRLLWMEKYGVLTHYSMHMPSSERWSAIIPLTADKGKTFGQCMADHCRLYEDFGGIGYGSTEEDAVRDLAIKAELKLWNEE